MKRALIMTIKTYLAIDAFHKDLLLYHRSYSNSTSFYRETGNNSGLHILNTMRAI